MWVKGAPISLRACLRGNPNVYICIYMCIGRGSSSQTSVRIFVADGDNNLDKEEENPEVSARELWGI